MASGTAAARAETAMPFNIFGEEAKPPFEPFNWLWCEYRKRGILPMNAPLEEANPHAEH
ncbi:MAG: hypothetical protein ACLP4V_04010 [Methylocella sp.]